MNWFGLFFGLTSHFGKCLVNIAELDVCFYHKRFELLVKFGITKCILTQGNKRTHNLDVDFDGLFAA